MSMLKHPSLYVTLRFSNSQLRLLSNITNFTSLHSPKSLQVNWQARLFWSKREIFKLNSVFQLDSNHNFSSLPLKQCQIKLTYFEQRCHKHKGTKASNRLNNHDETDEKEHKERSKKKEKKPESLKSSEKKAQSASNLAKSDDDEFDKDNDSEDEEYTEGILPNPNHAKALMLKHVERFEEYLKTVRGAEPSPELFDQVTVDAYGDKSTPLQAVAQVVLTSHTLATANCYDPTLSKAVANAIRDKLSLNPSVDESGVVQIPIPRVSLETRQELSALVKKRAEVFRQRIRGVRRKALDVVKQGVAGKLEHVSKDDAYLVQKEIEAMADDMIQKINVIADKKQQKIMAV